MVLSDIGGRGSARALGSLWCVSSDGASCRSSRPDGVAVAGAGVGISVDMRWVLRVRRDGGASGVRHLRRGRRLMRRVSGTCVGATDSCVGVTGACLVETDGHDRAHPDLSVWGA